MAIYNVTGFYEYRGNTGNLEGRFSIDEKGMVTGEITDHGSQVPRQKIEGLVQKVRDGAELSFFKYPPDRELANLLYKLKRKDTAPDFSGLYTGLWYALPEAIAGRIGTEDARASMMVARLPETIGSEYAELELSLAK